MKALIINDTSDWYHWGCYGTSRGLHLLLAERFSQVDKLSIKLSSARTVLPALDRGFLDTRICQQFLSHWPGTPRLLECDTVVINGEGSIHHLNHNVHRLFYIAVIAKTFLGKRVWIVNHSCFPDPDGDLDDNAQAIYRRAYAAADYIAVRESKSVAELKAFGVTNVQLAFDCLPIGLSHLPISEQTSENQTVCFAGTSGPIEPAYATAVRLFATFARLGLRVVWPVGAPANPAKDELRLSNAVEQAGFDFERIETTSLHEWAAIVKNARFAILGRFHHSICRLWKTPNMLVYGGNTAKISAYLADLALSDRYVETPMSADVERYLSEDLIETPPDLRQDLLNRARSNIPVVRK